MRWHLTLTAVAVAGAVLLAGCSNDGSTAAPEGPGNEAPADDEPDDAPGDDAPDGDAPLADGEHFGFLAGVDAEAGTVTFDAAVWVSSEEEPNGYRIDNPDAATVELPLADGAAIEVLMSTGDPSTATQVDAAGLGEWFAGPAAGQELAFDVELDGGEITALTFVYRP